MLKLLQWAKLIFATYENMLILVVFKCQNDIVRADILSLTSFKDNEFQK